MKDEKDRMNIPEIKFRGEQNKQQEPNFILVSQNKTEPKQATTTRAEERTHQAKQQATMATEQTQTHTYHEEKQTTGNEQQAFSTHTTNPHNENYSNQHGSSDIPKFSWKKPFFTSMAGALLGCSIFAGGYTATQAIFKDDSTSQSTQSSNSYIQPTTTTTETAAVVAAVSPGIVTVLTGNRMGSLMGNGSGVVYKEEQGKIYILTNAHVVADAAIVEVYRNDLGSDAADSVEVLAVDEINDIAVLVIEKPEQAYPVSIDFENTDTLEVGQKVIAVGSPYVATLGTSFSGSVTEGIISGLNREIESQTKTGLYRSKTMIQRYIQTDAAINGGNSGGALIDMNGNLVGINSAKISSAENMGLAISANDVLETLKAMDVPLPNVVSE